MSSVDIDTNNDKITSTDRIISTTAVQLVFKDTNAKSGMIQMNANRMYFYLAGQILKLIVK